MSDDTVADAVSLRLAAAIDAAARVHEARRQVIFGDSWPLAWATRSRILHGYIFIDRRIIENTVQENLPQIESAMRHAVEGASKQGPAGRTTLPHHRRGATVSSWAGPSWASPSHLSSLQCEPMEQ